jgi:hypothetical protein
MNTFIYRRIIFLITVSSILFAACEKEDEKIWEDSIVKFTIQNEDRLSAPAQVRFINNSKNAEEYLWKFPRGKIVDKGVLTADTITKLIQPDAVFYPFPGTYEAILIITADGQEREFKKTFTVKKPIPRIEFKPAGIVYDSIVTFTVDYFKYPGMENKVTFNWNLGNGETSNLPSPQTSYNPPGEYVVSVEIFDGYETVRTTRNITVQAEVAKTLYFVNAINKSIYKKVLYTGTDLPHENLQTEAGLNALSLSVYQERLIITVAGQNIRFAAEGTPADGFIFTTNLNGGDRWTITAAGTSQDYRDDPFVGTVGPDGTVYWVNRFRGASRIHYSEKDAPFPSPYVFHQASEGSDLAKAIGVGSAFGWTDGAVRIVNNELWYSKHGTGKGLYRFTTAGAYLGKIDPLFDLKIRTFEVDTKNGKIYFAVNQAAGNVDPGVYVCNIDGTNIQLIDPLEDFSMQGGEAERTFVTEMALDVDGGYLYYPFRHEEDLNYLGNLTGDGSKSGIKRWKLNGSEEPEFYVTGVIPYGMGIDHVKR